MRSKKKFGFLVTKGMFWKYSSLSLYIFIVEKTDI